MTKSEIKKVVIVGGGTAGWMTAAALSKCLPSERYDITLLESDAIGTVGVGEATIPHLRFFNQRLGIDEREFMRATQATYKLGIEFSNWGKLGDSYIHPFGDFGKKVAGVPFYHHFKRLQKQLGDFELSDFSYAVQLAKQNRFDYPSTEASSIKSTYSYAFHIDASQYALYLRNFSEERGVSRINGIVEKVNKHEQGHIDSLTLQSGETLCADFFVDCSGFRSLLLGQSLSVPFEDWSQWLPCDRAIAVPTESVGEPKPYTQAIARSAGWQWRIPLQHRTGNGHVYSSAHMSDDEAAAVLTSNLEGAPLADLNFLKFKAGRRTQTWRSNCVAIGLSSGFLEPLESTSIYLIQLAIMKLIEFFPLTKDDEVQRDLFNEDLALEYERIKDFLILHYHATQRTDSEFWNYVRTMSVPDSLQEKMDIFRASGHVMHYQKGLFLVPSWVAVYWGQNILPERHNHKADAFSAEKSLLGIKQLKQQIDEQVAPVQSHRQAIERVADASVKEVWPKAAMSLYGVFS